MEVSQIVRRFAEGLAAVDQKTKFESANPRTGEVYLPGVKSLPERKFVEELSEWWSNTYPDDFIREVKIVCEVPYLNIPRAKCDLTLYTDGSPSDVPEWAIEVKNIALVGNNGKNNDFGVAKILSPYLKDRSLIHDIARIKNFKKGKRKAVIGYCFEYSFTSCDESNSRFPKNTEYIENIRNVCKTNDPVNGIYSPLPMIQFADEIFQSRKLVKPLVLEKFENAWRHPCGGSGYIFGWEVNQD
jgi:hypothetical protein